MKHRTGFVSNSSSTSFCVIGTRSWQNDEFENTLYKLGWFEGLNLEMIELKKKYPENFSYPDEFRDLCYERLGYLEWETNKDGLKIYGEEATAPSMIGLDVESFGQDKTINQMIEETFQILAKYKPDISKESIRFWYGEMSNG